jgi:bifunctional UDP-N-acetylglucosamine pyrophosphorylase/glucosamine-1-phosphate N-acetyltransferase
MVSDLPKILHAIGGKTMVHHVMDAALAVQTPNQPPKTIVVTSPAINAQLVQGGRPVSVAIQQKPLGTGDAVKAGLETLSVIPQTVLIVCGDTPLLDADLLSGALTQHRQRSSPSITVVGMRCENVNRYGRIVADDSGKINRIVEYRDASEPERAIPLCNSGIIIADGALLKRLVSRLVPQNEADEYYLTDIVALAGEEGVNSWVVELPAEALQGINTRVDLAAAEAALQQRWRQRFMEQGVTLTDPPSVFFCHDTRIGRDVTISPNVTFGEGVTIGDRVRILPGCHIEKSTIGHDTTVGPFAHLREGAVLGDHVSIGNFVEIKSTTVGSKTKAKHLSYLGNATIGENVNIGAGAITCNHNGFIKSSTKIGDGAYIGSNSCLVAPVSIGDGAIVAAGSVVNSEVPKNALAIARHPQQNKLTWAEKFRARYK